MKFVFYDGFSHEQSLIILCSLKKSIKIEKKNGHYFCSKLILKFNR